MGGTQSFRRGQASVEYLLLSLVTLSLLSLSVLALINVKGSSEKNSRLLNFRSSSVSLANAIREVCALGDGNGRELSLDSETAIEPEKADEGWVVRFSGENSSTVRASPCEVEAAEGLFGRVYVENEEGTVSVTAR
jgi:hypothetical protein